MAQLRTRSRQKSNTPTPQQSNVTRPRKSTQVAESPRRSARLGTQASEAAQTTKSSAGPAAQKKRNIPNVEIESKQAQRPKTKATALAELPPVKEAESDETNSGVEHDEDDESVESSVVPHYVRRLERLQGQEQKLMDHLLDLSHESSGMLRILLPRPGNSPNELKDEIRRSMDQLRNSESNKSRRLHDREQRFDEIFRLYDDYYFIDHAVILRALFSTNSMDDIPSESWRPDEIFYDANLAVLTRDVFTLHPRSTQTLQKLQLIDNSFPVPFLASFDFPEAASIPVPTFGGSRLARKTLSAAIAIRTQLLIMNLRTSTMDPTTLLNKVFYKSDNERKLKGWPILGLDPDSGNMSAFVKSKLALQVQNIRESLQGRDEGIANLVERYPWSDFVVEIVEWIRLRHDEITIKVAEFGELDDVHDQFVAEIEQRNAARSVSKSGKSPQSTKRFVRGSRSSLKYINDSLETMKGSMKPSTTGIENAAVDELGGEGVGETDEDAFHTAPADNEAIASSPPAISRTPAKTPRTSRAFFDRQNGAEKLSQASLGSPTPDHGFQHDRRGKRITQQPLEPTHTASIRSSQSPMKRRKVRHTAAAEDDALFVPEVEDVIRVSTTQRSQDRDKSAEIRPNTLASSEQQAEAYIAAKEYTSTQPKIRKPQTRTPWSMEEITTLIDLVGWVGCSWAKVKQKDEDDNDVLHLRDQYAIKDKARNMKFDYLSSGVTLPKNFEDIRLDAKLIARLEERGIPYEQERMRRRRVVVNLGS